MPARILLPVRPTISARSGTHPSRLRRARTEGPLPLTEWLGLHNAHKGADLELDDRVSFVVPNHRGANVVL